MDQQEGHSESSGESSGDEGGVVDYAQILAEQNQALSQQSKTVDQLRRQLGESSETMSRVKKAFTGEQEQRVDPSQARINEHEQFLDYFLQQGLEAERRGQPIPLTVTLGSKLAQENIASEKRAAKLEAKLAQLEGKINRQEDTGYRLTDQAAAVMEGMLQEGLAQVYGDDESSERTRAAQFEAVAGRISEEIKDLMKNDPKVWDKVRRNPASLRKMVNHFVGELIPPKARQMLENQRIQDVEQSTDELYIAFNQAKQMLENAGSDREIHEYTRVMDSIRQDIIGRQYGGGGSRNGQPSLNKLLTGHSRYG